MEPVKSEVEKPFKEKLKKAKTLIRLYCRMCPRGGFVSCSFGKDSVVVLSLVLEENPSIPVVFNNTGVQFRETYEFKDRLAKEWNVNLIELRPVEGWSFWRIAEEKGLDDGKKYRDACCDYLKEIPLRRLIKKMRFRYNFTGITALESRTRMFRICQSGTHYYSKKDGILRIHPIAYWTPEEVWNYIHEQGLPYNPAYEKYGIDRVGCVPCTSHKGWREQLAKVNPKMYAFIQEKFFGQKILEVGEG